MSVDDNIALNNVRALLKIHEEHGLLEAVADTARLPVWILRNWVQKPEEIPMKDEVDSIRRALVRLHHDQQKKQPDLFVDIPSTYPHG